MNLEMTLPRSVSTEIPSSVSYCDFCKLTTLRPGQCSLFIGDLPTISWQYDWRLDCTHKTEWATWCLPAFSTWRALQQKGSISTLFYKKWCPTVEIGPGAWLFAFHGSSTIYGAGEKKSAIFWFFFIFFRATWKSELPGSFRRNWFSFVNRLKDPGAPIFNWLEKI